MLATSQTPTQALNGAQADTFEGEKNKTQDDR